MTPELRYIGSVDIDDLETWRPDDPAFWVILDLKIASPGERGADIFNLYVCSPRALEEIVAEKGVQDGRHLLILEEFDYPRIHAWVDTVLERSTGADWDEVADKLSRYFEWEFEDYVADPDRGSSPADIDAEISGEPDT